MKRDTKQSNVDFQESTSSWLAAAIVNIKKSRYSSVLLSVEYATSLYAEDEYIPNK